MVVWVLGAVALAVLMATARAASGQAHDAANVSTLPPGQSPPVNTSPPSISGTTTEGQTLTASPGSWNGRPASYTYQWNRCAGGCSPIASANSTAYTLTGSDIGATVSVTVVASNKNGSTAATSAPTSPIAGPAGAATSTTTVHTTTSVPTSTSTAQATTTSDTHSTSTTTRSTTTTTTTKPTTTTTASTTTATTKTTTASTSTTTPPASSNCYQTLADDFETVFGTASGLNPNACAPVYATKPGDTIRAQGTWLAASCISNVVPPSPGSGSRAARVAAGAGANCTWANRWRYIQLNSDSYYGMMWYFPAGWSDPAPGGWEASWELNFHPYIWGAPVALSTHGSSMKVSLQTGYCVWGKACSYDNGGEYENALACNSGIAGAPPCTPISPSGSFIIPKGQMTTGVWHEIILHVHWAADTSGYVEGWWRKKGSGTWTKTVSLSGFPTVQWGTDDCVPTGSCPGQNIAWSPSNLNGVTTDDHFGLYRAGGSGAAVTYYLDDLDIGTSFASVTAALP
jgi:Polysaccharide lyase